MPTEEFVYHRSPNYGKVPETLLHDKTASDGAIRLYAHIQWRAGRAHKSFESQETMAARMGVTEKTIKKRLAELEQRDWVVTQAHNYNPKTKKRATNIYHIFEVQTDCKQFREDHKSNGITPKSMKIEPRKSRKGIGGKPTHNPNSSTGSSDVNGTDTNAEATGTQVRMDRGTQVPVEPVLKDYPVQKTKDSNSHADAASSTPAVDKPKQAKPRDRLFDAIAFAFRTNGGYTSKLKQFLTGQMADPDSKRYKWQIDPANPMTAPEVVGFRVWCEREELLSDRGRIATESEKLHERVDEFRGVANYEMFMAAGQRKLDDEISPLPVEEGQGAPADGIIDLVPEISAEKKKILDDFFAGKSAVNQ